MATDGFAESQAQRETEYAPPRPKLSAHWKPLKQSNYFSGMTATSLPGPISSALSWTLQRLSSDESPPPKQQRQLSEKSSPRRLPSFAPPPLSPLRLSGYSPATTGRVLSRVLAEEIRLLLPPRLQLHDNWGLAYSLEQHGVSLATLYDRCRKGSFVLVVKDALGGVFGCFVNEPFQPFGRYYGTGECFLWKATVLPHSSPDSVTSPNTDRLRFKAFPYSGINDYMILCEPHFLSVGGGDGKYGLWLDDIFEKGISSSCMTFGNEPLSEEGEKFEVISVEVWCVGG